MSSAGIASLLEALVLRASWRKVKREMADGVVTKGLILVLALAVLAALEAVLLWT